MAESTVEDLVARESQLTWSFAGFAAAWLATYAWPVFMASYFEEKNPGAFLIWLLLLLVQLCLRGWYAYAAARTGRGFTGPL